MHWVLIAFGALLTELGCLMAQKEEDKRKEKDYERDRHLEWCEVEIDRLAGEELKRKKPLEEKPPLKP